MEIPEEEVSVNERVKCPCGSEVMLKNLKQHEKTAKHQNGGKVSRKATHDKWPAEIQLSKNCLDENQFKTLDQSAAAYTPTTKVQRDIAAPIKPVKKTVSIKAPETESDEDDDDFEEIVLDDLKTLDNKLEAVIELLNQGFSALLGDEKLPTIPEESGDSPIAAKI